MNPNPFGYFAGYTASQWTQKAAQWAASGKASSVRDCCYNAAKAAFGTNAPWAQIQSYAEGLLRTFLR